LPFVANSGFRLNYWSENKVVSSHSLETGVEKLKIALVHLNIHYNQPEHNQSELVFLNREAAEAGAKIIVNTELCISGYSFRSRDEIARAVQTIDGPMVRALSAIASDYGVHIVAGYAECDEATGIIYNAATALTPEGTVACHYRKISAEVRWACPGIPQQQNTFQTPWGRVGILICSDTYFGALPRATALRGADIILVPANWPSDPLDPAELWQSRAFENGVYIAACNRCGTDRTMVFHNAQSCCYGPSGEAIVQESSTDSRIIYASLPLHNGKLAGLSRERLQSRTPQLYTPMYLDMRYASDLTSYYELPKPVERVLISSALLPEQVFSSSAIESILGKAASGSDARILVLPAGRAPSIEEAEDTLIGVATRHGIDVCAGYMNNSDASDCIMIMADDSGHIIRHRPQIGKGVSDKLCVKDIAGARVLLACSEELMHPELALAAAKLGCDLAVSSTGNNHHEQMSRVIATRSIEQLYVAVAGNNKAFICEPPENHHRWNEVVAYSYGSCSMKLDSSKSRNKRFYDRFDYDLLLVKEKLELEPTK
jgi:predicted amidohydrolase